MRKPEMVRETSKRTGYTLAVCDEIISECFHVIADTLAAYEEVRIPNIGVIEVRDYDGRQYYDIHSGELKRSGSMKKVKFRPSSVILNLVNA